MEPSWGGGAMLLAQRYVYGVIGKPVWMLDSFQGLPPATEQDGPRALHYQQNIGHPTYYDNCRASFEHVRKAAARFGFDEQTANIVPGWFNQTIPLIEPTLPKKWLQYCAWIATGMNQ